MFRGPEHLAYKMKRKDMLVDLQDHLMFFLSFFTWLKVHFKTKYNQTTCYLNTLLLPELIGKSN
jgi:hypothetical protein